MGDLEISVGYVLKQAQAALRGAMDAVLAPLELTVPQYSCLELIAQRSGASGSDLARGAFVSRQAMNQVLRGLQDRGLLARPAAADHGRALPVELTADGRRALHAASVAVADVERRCSRRWRPRACSGCGRTSPPARRHSPGRPTRAGRPPVPDTRFAPGRRSRSRCPRRFGPRAPPGADRLRGVPDLTPVRAVLVAVGR